MCWSGRWWCHFPSSGRRLRRGRDTGLTTTTAHCVGQGPSPRAAAASSSASCWAASQCSSRRRSSPFAPRTLATSPIAYTPRRRNAARRPPPLRRRSAPLTRPAPHWERFLPRRRRHRPAGVIRHPGALCTGHRVATTSTNRSHAHVDTVLTVHRVQPPRHGFACGRNQRHLDGVDQCHVDSQRTQ